MCLFLSSLHPLFPFPSSSCFRLEFYLRDVDGEGGHIINQRVVIDTRSACLNVNFS